MKTWRIEFISPRGSRSTRTIKAADYDDAHDRAWQIAGHTLRVTAIVLIDAPVTTNRGE